MSSVSLMVMCCHLLNHKHRIPWRDHALMNTGKKHFTDIICVTGSPTGLLLWGTAHKKASLWLRQMMDEGGRGQRNRKQLGHSHIKGIETKSPTPQTPHVTQYSTRNGFSICKRSYCLILTTAWNLSPLNAGCDNKHHQNFKQVSWTGRSSKFLSKYSIEFLILSAKTVISVVF